MRAHFKASQHPAAGRVNFDYVEFGVPRYSLWMGADVKFAGLAERHCVELTAVAPLTEKFPLRVEPLHATILTVGDIHISLRANSEGMDYIEFTWTGATFPPFADLPSARVVLNDARVAIAVSDKHMTVPGESYICRAAKVLRGVWHIAHTDLQQLLSFPREFVDPGGVGIHRPDVAIWIQAYAMGNLEHSLTP